MAGGPQDLVDCARLAAESRALQREYVLDQLPRLEDLLADSRGSLTANFEFGKAQSGRCVVSVAIQAHPHLVCQRCLEAYEFPVVAHSEVEIADEPSQLAAESEQEVYRSEQGLISLRELAEEELLLALPLVPACSTPESCGRAPAMGELKSAAPAAEKTVRPFAALQDLLKKHDRK